MRSTYVTAGTKNKTRRPAQNQTPSSQDHMYLSIVSPSESAQRCDTTIQTHTVGDDSAKVVTRC